jgi:putative ABC transport system substrate-binding protein
MLDTKRREVIALLGAGGLLLAVKVRRARAQQASMPVIGFLNASSPEAFADRLRAFRHGLKEAGFVEGENVAIEYRWAEGQYDRLPALAVELVRRQVAVIAATGGSPVALAAKAATATIPIVFTVPEDPVRLGLVASLARPGGNATGINFFSGELAAKRLGLLRELIPPAARVALLIDPATMDSILEDAKAAARTMGLQIQIVHASTIRDIEAAFASFGRERPDALLVGGGPFLFSRRIQLALLAARYEVPASYGSREYPEVGGLMSYGTSLTDAYRQVGLYAGRVLKGARPADLPVLQATKFELVINHPAAKALGLDIPTTVLARADEVIE